MDSKHSSNEFYLVKANAMIDIHQEEIKSTALAKHINNKNEICEMEETRVKKYSKDFQEILKSDWYLHTRSSDN